MERTFEIWKRRFPCLSQGLRTKIETCTTIVVACAVLHNMALRCNDIFEEEEQEKDNINDDNEVPVMPVACVPREGLVTRRNIIQRLFP